MSTKQEKENMNATKESDDHTSQTHESKEHTNESKTSTSSEQEKGLDAKELLDSLQRLQAEFENAKKRSAREQEVFRKFATEGLIKELLPVMDNFSITLKHQLNALDAKTNESKDAKSDMKDFVKSIELTYAQFVEIMEGHGVKQIDATNKEFDPRLHEALMTKEAPKDNIVLEVMQEGYTLNDRVLRTAKVIVGKKA